MFQKNGLTTSLPKVARAFALAMAVALPLSLSLNAKAAECAGQFGDFVWYDANGDGIQDPGEPGIAGVELSLYDAANNLLQTTVTDANGAYYLYYYTVCGENYKIVLNEATVPAGLVPTLVEAGVNTAVDSNQNPWMGILPLPAPGENFSEDLSIDFGLVDEPEACTGRFGNFVWYDANENGVQDGGEPGIAGVELSLFDSSNALLQTTVTDANGAYILEDGVICGQTYRIELNLATVPAGLVPTIPQAVGDTALDSNPNPFIAVLPLPAPGENFSEDLTIDFGFIDEPGDDPDYDKFRTQTQGGWGAACNGGNPGCYRDAWFPVAFPDGIVIGCIGNKYLKFTSSLAVENFLPSGGKACALKASAVDPVGKTSAGVLAGQLLALALSLGFDAADPDFGASDSPLGSQLLCNTGTAGDGLTVQQIFDEANLVMGGCGQTLGLNVDTLNTCLTVINENYVDGTTNNGSLCNP
ncbi:MAG: hypothetical protein HYV27_13025 [Candidatus Hydrogenedentes bacterium]|nr:hypothetical protein [Candidatus Hydrogenedentota bacterium]